MIYTGVFGFMAPRRPYSRSRSVSERGTTDMPDDQEEHLAPVSKTKLGFSQNIARVIYGLLAVSILVTIGLFGLSYDDGLILRIIEDNIEDKQAARGLITFLIAITTVGIAVMLVIFCCEFFSEPVGGLGGVGANAHDRPVALAMDGTAMTSGSTKESRC
jgi:hypothetical protein